MTVSELAAAKGVTLQNANYSDFWDSSLQKGIVAGYSGNTTDASGDEAQMVRIRLLMEVQIHRMEVLTMVLPMMNL